MERDREFYFRDWSEGTHHFKKGSMGFLAREAVIEYVEPEQAGRLKRGEVTEVEYYVALKEAWSIIFDFIASTRLNPWDSSSLQGPVWHIQNLEPKNLIYLEGSFHFIKEDLENAVEKYLRCKNLKSSYIDWIFLQSQTFLELSSFSREKFHENVGFIGILLMRLFKDRNISAQFCIILSNFIRLSLNIIIPIMIIVKLYPYENLLELAFPAFLAIGMASYAVTFPYRLKERKIVSDLINHMIFVYKSTSSSTLSPRMIKRYLDMAVEKGIQYHHSIFIIADRLMSDRNSEFFRPFDRERDW